MTKTVRKSRPVDNWQIGENESWLSDMAAQGLHLKKMGHKYAKFEKAPPKKMNYRIEVTPKNVIDDEQIDLYEANGWDYVTSVQNFHVFSSPVERNAPEIHTDPAEQSFTLHQLNEKLTTSALLGILGLIVMIGMLYAMWFLDGTPVYMLVDGSAIQSTFLTAAIFMIFLMSFRGLLSIYRLRRNLLEGKPMNHHAPWKRQHRINTIFQRIYISISIVVIILAIIQLTTGQNKTLPVGDIDLPIVRLADIEQNPALIRDEYFIDEVDWANRYSVKWNLFSKALYDTNESGIVAGQMWGDGSGEYSPSLDVTIFDLRIKLLANQLIEDLIERSRFLEERTAYVEVQHPKFDKLVVYEDEYSKAIFAVKNKRVMRARYYGIAELDTVIEQVVKKLE